jgi:gamma-glutamyltranspeptidase
MGRVNAATRWAECRSTRGLIATPHALASEAGLAVLERGGNAVDAAIAAGGAIAVVYHVAHTPRGRDRPRSRRVPTIAGPAT